MKKNELLKIIKSKYWSVDKESNTSYRLSKYSNAGEDYGFSVDGATADEMVADIKRYADNFDIEEHIEMWVEAKKNGVSGVPSILELVEDAKAIAEDLRSLAEAVNQ